MKHRAIDQVLGRVEQAKSDSDFTYFFALLLAAEALAKTVTLGIVSALGDDKDRNRYRVEHTLARSDGFGDWSRAIEDALTGPASQYLIAEAYPEQTELTRLCRQGEWQYEAVRLIRAALDELAIESEELPVKSDMKRWFRLLATLRNKTRGHGATPPSRASRAASHLYESINLFYANHSVFERPWAYLHRNLSGKYRVSAITERASAFDNLKREADHRFVDGVYIHFGTPRLVPLLQTDPELHDFYFANGGFSAKGYELLSYATDDRVDGGAADYSLPPGTLPPSETEGYGELLPRGECFSNAPDLIGDYIARARLEDEIVELLLDDRRPIVTLVGRGGIGKTSLSIRAVNQLYDTGRYAAIIWLSARDVDLQLGGPKAVRPVVLSPEDMSRFYANLVLSREALTEREFNSRAFFEGQLTRNDLGPCLYVFDNFETAQNPVELFNWIDSYLRLPNKALITTRLRDFKGDYPVDVSGMEEPEAKALIESTSRYLGIKNLLTGEYVAELIEKAEGHPYVMKILLGEVARAGRLQNVARMVAGSEDVLTALFERTYAALSPCAQRAFMTLAAWNSPVPRLAVEAVLIRSTQQRQEVEKGIESLLQFSMVEAQAGATEVESMLGLPLVASVFGKKKLNVSPLKSAIAADVEILQMLGPTTRGDVHIGLAKRLEKFIGHISARLESGEAFEYYSPILEMICRAYNPGWLLLGRWHLENGDVERAKEELRRYLENDPTSAQAGDAWRMLAYACYRTGDELGEIHAFVERAQIEGIPFYDVSNTANQLNRYFREHSGWIDQEEKRQLVHRLLKVLHRRRQEANADDLSKMAWLSLHMDQLAQAREYAEAGLVMDPENPHCMRLLERLSADA